MIFLCCGLLKYSKKIGIVKLVTGTTFTSRGLLFTVNFHVVVFSTQSNNLDNNNNNKTLF